jgi:hypothetical protein
VKAYAKDGNRKRGWHFLYKADPNNIDTNISQHYSSEDKLMHLITASS